MSLTPLLLDQFKDWKRKILLNMIYNTAEDQTLKKKVLVYLGFNFLVIFSVTDCKLM